MKQQELSVGSLPDSYNQNPQRPDVGRFPLNVGVCDTLFRLNEDLRAEPMLATGWSQSKRSTGPSGYRLQLRRGVRFHDGQELSAHDVKFSLDVTIAGSPHNHLLLGPESVQVVDRHTVEISPLRHNSNLIEQLVHPVWGIIRRGSDPQRPIGSGPYRLAEYIKGEKLVVERFTAHWRPTHSRPRPDRIAFVFTEDSDARVAGLIANELDLIIDVPGARVAELRARPEIAVVFSRPGAYNALSFNIGGIPPFDRCTDRLLRHVVATAIDRKAVLEAGWAGNADENTTWIPPAVLGPYASRVRGPVHDPALAARLLHDSGWELGEDGVRAKQGRALVLRHVLGGPGDSDPRDSFPAAAAIQGQLRKVGIETVIEVAGRRALRDGQYDIYQGVANQNEAYAARLPDIIYYSKGGPEKRFRAPGGRTDEAIERAREATTSEEVQRYAAEAAHQLVDVEQVIVPLVTIRRIWAMHRRVTGFDPHPSLTNQRWEGITFDEE